MVKLDIVTKGCAMICLLTFCSALVFAKEGGNLGYPWESKQLAVEADYLAPDGSEVRLLANDSRGNMAHFRLRSGVVAKAVAHKTIDKLWYVVSGEGEIWLRSAEDGSEEIVQLRAGLSLSIPVGTHFQFRNTGDVALNIVGTSMPPWPGEEEAYPVEGKWDVD